MKEFISDIEKKVNKAGKVAGNTVVGKVAGNTVAGTNIISDLYEIFKILKVVADVTNKSDELAEKYFRPYGIEPEYLEKRVFNPLVTHSFALIATKISGFIPGPVFDIATTVIEKVHELFPYPKTIENLYRMTSGVTLGNVSPKIILDPSGIVRNAITNLPIKDVLTQIYYRDKAGKEVLWDAGEYSQINPLRTTINGEYAWDVPAGFWKVKVSKEGYSSAESDWLEVPPPRTDVHFNLVPNTYKINYNLNGGTFVGDLLSTYQTDVKKDLLNPERQGYKFDGWYDNANLKGNKVVDTLFSSLGDKTLWAKWIQDTVAPVINVITDKPKVAPTREVLPELDINLVIDKKEDSNTGGVITYVPEVAPAREVLPEYDIVKLLEEIKSNQEESTKPLAEPASNSGTKERKVNANNNVLPKTSSHSEDSELPLALASALLTAGLITSRRKNN